ncbi:hypothetical protein EST38_g11071 [Candolleomyces aberdarensis]|uniref:Uncharacterized protein n=1 Tax=Candolleomyces aberdarensis TaxID=2316362 RepID=A0A4Q2D5S8_9AGAR|nr:hypothetical protein EST38_g11071 [Candolleomyces aberdarensis]
MSQSPVHSVLGTNYVPTEQECDKIVEFLDGHENRLAELQAKIAEEEAILQKLRERYEELRDNVDTNAHRALISLFRRLPDDILREIFLHCLPPHRNPAMCTADPPLLLTRVCGRWRQVAFSTPRLWTSLHILHISNYSDGAQIPERKLDSQEVGILQWIGRAGSMPLSITFPDPGRNLRMKKRNYRPTDLKRLLCLLSPSFSRWQKLDFFLEGSSGEVSQIVELQDEEGRNPFRQLEQLSVRVYLRWWEDGLGDSESVNENSHKFSMLLGDLLNCNKQLRRLGLYLAHIRALRRSLWLTLTQIIPCAQLEVLDLQGDLRPHHGSVIPIDLLSNILQASPQLVVFKANVGHPGSQLEQPVPTSTVTLNRLKQVSFFFPDWKADHFSSDFITKCDWPALTSLYLRKRQYSTYKGDLSDVYLLSAFADQVSNTLTSLRLSSSGIYQDDLIDVMFALPALVQIHLEHPGLSLSHDEEEESFGPCDAITEVLFDDHIITHLTPQPDGTHALPQLRFLKWERNTGFSDKALAYLLRQRSASPFSPAPMKQVHIYFGRKMEEDILPVCSDLIEAGLDLRLKYPPSFDTSRDSTYESMGYVQPLNVDHQTFGWD